MSSRVSPIASLDDDWQTPKMYTQAACRVMGGLITLDPASSVEANVRVGATHLFTKEMDGLYRDWFGNVWCNPPYGMHPCGKSNMALWTAKLLREREKGNVEQAILLVTAVPDRKWFKPLTQFPICFADHQILFHKPDGTTAHHAYGSCFVYMGPNREAFIEEFSAFGDVMEKQYPKKASYTLV